MPLSDLLSECWYQTSQSGGPGGQHANKVETQVELRFDVAASEALSPTQKLMVMERLGPRLTKNDVLMLRCHESRSQQQNKERVQKRFLALIAWALTPPKSRKRSRPPRRVKEKRLEQKRRRSEKKQWRKPPEG
jgi:ribosome-associated protein